MNDMNPTQPIDKLLTALTTPTNSTEIAKRLCKVDSLQDNDYHFFKISSLSHVSDAPRREALENVYSSIRYPGASVVYILKGDVNGVALYLGIARNRLYSKPLISISDISENILKPNFEGNFRGSHIEQLTDKGKELVNKLQAYRHVGVLQGTVGDQAQGENAFFQGIDRLVDVMTGSDFCLAITASCVAVEEIMELEQWLYRGYELLAPLARVSLQHGKTTGRSLSAGESKGESRGTSFSTNSSSSDGWNKGTSKSANKRDSSESGTEGSSGSTSTGTSDGKSESTSSGTNHGISLNQGETLNVSEERHNRQAQQWLSYLDDLLLQRVDYGRSRGSFICNISLLTNSHHTLLRLGDVTRSIFSGNIGNQYPLQMLNISSSSEWIQSVKNFQIPVIPRQSNNDQILNIFDGLKSRININGKVLMGAYVTPKELSLVAGLPQEEVVGIELKEQVTFGLNPPKVSVVDSLILGSLIQDGRILNHKKVALNRDDLNKHVFVAGVTGSGKTTTCHHLLRESMSKFLVIEPAKTEYRMLLEEYDDLLVLTPGRDDIAPLKLNPLEMMPGETISSRVDIIKASFLASFDMEAAIPQVLEAAVYRCYEKMGWDINTSKHPLYPDPFAPGCYPFPILRDLLEASEQVVKEQGFDERLRQDYIGSIKARLQGLLVGAKGQIFNTLRSIDFRELIRRPVVIELEEIRNGAEKSLLIAFIMTNVIQALKNEHRKNPNFRHLTLIEEAHHLLTKADTSMSSNRRQAVEMFSDMLAEVRKYGEGLIIVDQIPNKLTPEVLKNTNTKIVHKLFAEDDKVAIGNTMALEPLQQQHLSRLETGQAVVFSQGWKSAVLTQIEPTSKTQADIPLDEIEPKLRDRAWEFYQLPYNLHVLPLKAQQPTLAIKDWQEQMSFSADINLLSTYTKYVADPSEKNHHHLKSVLKMAEGRLGSVSMVIEHLLHHIYIPSKDEPHAQWRNKLQACYPLLFEKDHAKVVRKENLHINARRKY
ncbi:ATP-binding protein [Acinetobacter sp. YH16058]|uniref:ATP-binding protein n=1 Tax=Acinetobacter sp. YH16058 TaxID=2601196 RepID=UPI0015D44230|nr:ATP-binding protein [Acinetobacter sp. YH16058]